MFWTLVVTAIILIYFYSKRHYGYWHRKGVQGPEPLFLLGNFGRVLTMKVSLGQILTEIYNDDVVGLFRVFTPVLLIRDPELIKEVTVKSFSNFHDNDVEVDKEVDTIMGRNPFVLKGEEWKVVRAHMTPGFTSGKMKWLFPLLEKESQSLLKFIEEHPQTRNGEGYEMKEMCARFTLNNTASCAFGINGKCLEEEDPHFKKLATDFFSSTGWTAIFLLVLTTFPYLSKYIKIRFVSKAVEKELINMTNQTLKYRKDNNIVRNDYLQVLSQLKETSKDYNFTDLDIAAHAAGFIADGYETSSVVMSFVLFELAANPKVQNQLREEINDAFTKNNSLSYEVLQSLPYLDAVFYETLRKHPPAAILQKVCTKDCTLKTQKGSVLIKKDTPIVIPVLGLHHDEKYFEDHETFNPERFLPENQENITKYAFLPFGEGPRACLGQRFAILQIKIGVTYIIKNYILTVNKKTQTPIQYNPLSILTTAIGGLWVDFKQI